MGGISEICIAILIFLITLIFIKGILGKDKTFIWSPLTTISLTYIYYCVLPYFFSIDRFAIDESLHKGYLFHIASLLSFISILLGFKFGPTFNMKRWNQCFTTQNSASLGLGLFFIAMMGYVPYRGLHLTFTSAAEENQIQLMAGGFIYYLIFLIDILAASISLFLVQRNKFSKWKLIPLWVIISTYLYAGARWRLVVTIISSLTMVHLIPKQRKPNYLFIIGLMLAVFLGFSVMDQSRQRGMGINMEKAQDLSFNDIKSGAAENYSVYMFSMLTIEKLHETSIRYYFDPIVSAALMPIPRFIFPSKPNAEYIHDLERMTIGDDSGGAAFLNFVEGYLSFGWFGVILYGLILGIFAKGVWLNYRNNQDSIGAVLLLGLFSGFCYCAISRGYLPSTYSTALYVVCLPFWFCMLINNLIRKKK